MSYYGMPRGDYRTGGYGYPAGDPGLLGFLGKIVPKIWKVAKPFIGGVIGGVLGAPMGAPSGKAVTVAPPPVPGAGVFPGAPGGIPAAAGAVIGGAVAGYRGQAAVGGLCPTGYHPAKDGSGRCVRNRRMNIANPRALRRSMRRVQGFEKMARKTISFTKRVKMKKRRC